MSPTLAWLVRLRWGATVGHALLVAVAVFVLRLSVPVAPLVGVVVLEAASNVWLTYRARIVGDASSTLVLAVLGADVGILTALLFLSGGPINPLSVLYLVQITLGAVVLPPRYAWALVATATAGYGLLFFAHVDVPLRVVAFGEAVSLHLVGMWVAFVLAAALVTHFVGRTRAALAARDEELRLTREQAVARERAAHERDQRRERLASLATLAAGAAHELATPLGTIRLIAGELARRADAAEVRADAALVHTEVDRCRAILDQLAQAAGSPTGEAITATAAVELVAGLRDRLGPAERARLMVSEPPDVCVPSPRRALTQVLTSLVRNALDAGEADVALHVEQSNGETVRFVVEDHGEGIAPEILARVGEPFFTTKAAGRGMGLGLFLARALAEQLGGTLALDSERGRGTRATLELPLKSAVTLAAAAT